jgi:multicomponent Na+:H+ antiporter subunit C
MNSSWFSHLPYLTVAALLVIGLAGVLYKKNLVKILMSVAVMEAAVNLFLVATGYRMGGIAPIYTNAPEGAVMTLPTVQALTLTAIVIGVATSALMLSFAMAIYKHYGTVNIAKIRKLKG